MRHLRKSWWDSDEWYAYERACGLTVGGRARLLRESPWQTRVVDLSLSKDDLWRGVRRSYHSLINRLIDHDSTFSVSLHGGNSGDLSGATSRAHTLHLREAGRETRPQASWDVQDKWVREGRAFVAFAQRLMICEDGPLDVFDVAFTYVVRHGDWAYYFNAANCERNTQHAAQWRMMLHLKEVGVRWYELGWQGEAHTDEERSIEFFKRGFGGTDYPASWRL